MVLRTFNIILDYYLHLMGKNKPLLSYNFSSVLNKGKVLNKECLV